MRQGRWQAAICGLAVLVLAIAPRSEASPQPVGREGISAIAFGGMIQDFSEDSGYFHSDNFVSNETSYLSIVDKLRSMRISGGAYIGVGPEQNFTYIARIRPGIAFIVDIRRQAVVQHLMYKAIFQRSENRAEFLALLLSRPLSGERAPGRRATIGELTEYFTNAPVSKEAYLENLAEIGRMISQDFHVPLTPQDRSSLEYVYAHFRDAGLSISYWPVPMSVLPSLKELIEQPDPSGRPGNFLAAEADYEFVRDMERANRIIPVVGDFAGPKALKAVAAYLRRNSYAVTAFYTSNVEEYLFLKGNLSKFAGNLEAFPITEQSLIIRADPNMWHRIGESRASRTVLQRIFVFLADYVAGIYTDFGMLFNTHCISADD